jgi:hypothetical protein
MLGMPWEKRVYKGKGKGKGKSCGWMVKEYKKSPATSD